MNATLADRQAARERYGATMLTHATHIVTAVHDEGPDAVQDAIAHALAIEAPPGVDPVEALVTVLAAAVPTNVPMNTLLDWVRPLQVAAAPTAPDPQTVNLLADVHVLMSGRAVGHQVSWPARREAVRQLARQGCTSPEIADRIGMDPRTVDRVLAQLRVEAPAVAS